MRQLNTEEKRFCQLIHDKKGTNMLTIIDDKLVGVRIRIQRKPELLKFLFEAQNETPDNADLISAVDRLQVLGVDVITIANLLKMLQDEGYIILYERANTIENEVDYGQGAVNAPSLPYRFPDDKLSSLFIEYSSKDIIVTPEFERFIKEGYISRDEQRYQTQIRTATTALMTSRKALRVSTIALCVATLIGTINLLYNIFGKSDKAINTFDPQIATVVSEIRSLGSKADTLINLQKKSKRILQKVSVKKTK